MDEFDLQDLQDQLDDALERINQLEDERLDLQDKVNELQQALDDIYATVKEHV